jgi:hypothetical protein
MDEYNWDLDELLHYIARWGFRERLSNLLRPHNRIWPEEEAPFDVCDEIFWHLDDAYRLPFLSVLAASALLSTESIKEEAFYWLSRKTPPSGLGLPFEKWQELLSWSWIKISIPLVSSYSGKGIIVDGLFGKGAKPIKHLLPQKAFCSMSVETRRAIDKARSNLPGGAEEMGLFFWPILDFEEQPYISGESLALPVYLAWRTLFEGCATPNLSATGAIDDNGVVLPVEGMDQKIRVAERHGLSGLIVPSGCTLTPEIQPKTELIPVSDLTEAWIVWSFYLPGKGASMSLLLHNSGSALNRAQMMLELPKGFLSTVEKRSNGISNALSDVLADKKDAHVFLWRLEKMALSSESDIEQLCLLTDPVTPDKIKKLKEFSPDNAFRICNIKISILNNMGRTQEADKCAAISKELIPSLTPWDEMDSGIFNFYNLRIVSLHNRYSFDPDITEKLAPELKGLLEQFTQKLALRRQRNPNAVSEALGSFFGTLAQHYGFCGHAFIDKFEAALEKALDAFGGGKVPGKPREEWLRDISYRIYACLEGEMIEDAEKYLLTYLQINHLADMIPTRDPFRLAALLRFAADAQLSGFMDLASSSIKHIPKKHPYQLCLYNAGRLKDAGTEARRRFWKESVLFSLSYRGATLRAMALLPLTRLYEEGLEDEDFLRQKTEQVLGILSTKELNTEHFRPILNAKGWEEALRAASAYSKSLFPFTYR